MPRRKVTKNFRKYTIRLYRSHDVDLLMMEQRGVNLMAAAKIALTAICRGEYFIIETPPPADVGYVEFEPYYVRILLLDPEKDDEEIAFLKSVHNGGKNNLIKNILRLYLFTPYNTRFLGTMDDADIMEAYFEPMREQVGVRACPEALYKRKKKRKPRASAIPRRDPGGRVTKGKNPRADEPEAAPVPPEETLLEEAVPGREAAGPVPEETGTSGEADIFSAFMQLMPE